MFLHLKKYNAKTQNKFYKIEAIKALVIKDDIFECLNKGQLKARGLRGWINLFVTLKNCAKVTQIKV